MEPSGDGNEIIQQIAVRLTPPGERISPLKDKSVDTLVAHVRSIFEENGVDPAERLAHVEEAVRRQQRAEQRRRKEREEKKRKEQEKAEKEAAAAAAASPKPPEEEAPKKTAKVATVGFDTSGMVNEGRAEKPKDEKSSRPEAPDETNMDWQVVQWFDDQDAALQFVLQCQPFDYQPDGVDWPEVMVNFEDGMFKAQQFWAGDKEKSRADAISEWDSHKKTAKAGQWDTVEVEGKEVKQKRDQVVSISVKSREEAVALAKQIDPIPHEFVSTAADFHRRLRIRHVPQEQPKQRKGIQARLRTQQARTRPQKPWCVEQSGDLFERFATNLRSLKEPGSKFYIAVDGNEVFEKVLAEGFRVTKRTSIPCCSTPQDALAAMKRHSDNVPNPRAVVLTVIDLPLGKDGKPVNVIARRPPQWKPKKDRASMEDARPTPAEQEPHGYLIQTNYLPANCFSKRKIGGTDAN